MADSRSWPTAAQLKDFGDEHAIAQGVTLDGGQGYNYVHYHRAVTAVPEDAFPSRESAEMDAAKTRPLADKLCHLVDFLTEGKLKRRCKSRGGTRESNR